MTEAEFFDRLRPRYPAPDWVLLPQVRNQTGFGRRVRTADAVAVSMYPSRGIDATGFEFKDSRADWQRELKEPAKSEEVGRFCAYWWLVTSGCGVAFADELPPAWGLMTVQKDGSLKVAKKAPRREAADPTWAFLASVLRAARDVVTDEGVVASRVAAAVRLATDGQAAAARAARDAERVSARREYADLMARVAAFEEAAGVRIADRWEPAAKIGAAVKFVLGGGVDGVRGELARIAETCDRVKAVVAGVAGGG